MSGTYITSETRERRVPRGLLMMLGLLAMSGFLSYVDRSNLSIAASMLKDELGISAAQLGILSSAFFWTYGLAMYGAGWLADRLQVGWVMGGGFLLWSGATLTTGFLHGFTAILVARLVLGVGESVAYPCYSNILAKYFPEERRGFANSMIAMGVALGNIFGAVAGGTLMALYGWRFFFIAIGVISLLWLVPWFRWMPRGPGVTQAHVLGLGPDTRAILKRRAFWGNCAGAFCFAYFLYAAVVWLPFYLMRERHYSMVAMARIGGAIYAAQALCSLLAARYTDRRASASGCGNVHRTFMVVGTSVGGTMLFLSTLLPTPLNVCALLVVGACLGLCMANTWSIAQILAGPQAAGRWTGLVNTISTAAGALVSAVTGYLLDRTGRFFWPFALTAAIGWTGALCWRFAVGRVQPVAWNQTAVVRFPTIVRTGVTTIDD
jgi:ACS family D-galactonate transporter-like MFS transporter